MKNKNADTQWKVDLTGPGNTLLRVACSIAALSKISWLSLIIFPAIAGGILVQSGFVSGSVGQMAYPIFCLCVWLTLATIGGSYRSVQYQIDKSNTKLVLARKGYDSDINHATTDQNPVIPLEEIRSITVTSIRGYQIIRLDYGKINLSKPDTIIIPSKDRSVWKELQQIQPNLPPLPPTSEVILLNYPRFVVTAVIIGVLPLAVIDQQLLVSVIPLGLFVITAGLLRNLISTIRNKRSSQDRSTILQSVLGTVRTLVVIGTIILAGYAVNILF